MIKNIKIEKYKSIEKLNLPLGRINVLIGENGAGKSNILEAIALAGAVSSKKLDNEFLTSRGIRVTRPEYMRSAFPEFGANDSISIEIEGVEGNELSYTLTNDNEAYSKWQCVSSTTIKEEFDLESFVSSMKSFTAEVATSDAASRKQVTTTLKELAKQLSQAIAEAEGGNKSRSRKSSQHVAFQVDGDNPLGKYLMAKQALPREPGPSLQNFIVYSPENSSLRAFQKEGQIEPLGINGEGLLRLMSVLHGDQKYSDIFLEIRRSLRVLGWFEDLDVVDEQNQPLSRIEIKDRYLDSARRYFDQMSTNEGFLFLVFYFALFSCDLTPKFFAVDNIDASLNPKLCSTLMKQLVELAKNHDKQVILTTHNPAILDGLNLDDTDQRLFVVSRNRQGYTRVKRVEKHLDKASPIRLSEAFLRGSLGGLPKGF